MVKEKDTAVAVVPDRSRLTALAGTIDERMKAFEQIAANIASLQLNGWDTVQKAKAACWLSDGAGMHPAIFMQNHYCMILKGRLTVEPKWEFIVGVLQSRMPGFQMEVLIETDDCAEVKMSAAGIKPQTVRYTLGDAKRQGLLGRDNAWQANPREMCLKQAIKRCGRRIGAAALMDLPISDEGYEVLNGDATPPSPADAIDQAIAKATADALKGVEVEFEEEPATATEEPAAPPATDSPRVRLHSLILTLYGKMSKTDAAAKISALYSEMMLERTGVEEKVDLKPGQIGPVEAEQLISYITAKESERPTDEDQAPSPEAAPTPEVKPGPKPAERGAQDAYDELMVTVDRARKLFRRSFIMEHPAGSGIYWFADMATFTQTGDKEPVKIQKAGAVVASLQKIEALNKVLAASCDARERAGR